jgi:imidazolonepropionase-like amidohydrolase
MQLPRSHIKYILNSQVLARGGSVGRGRGWATYHRAWSRHVALLAPNLESHSLERTASRAGVPLLAGTDLGDPYVIPGFSLHDELALMVKAGVTTLKALQSATSEPARAFGLGGTVGAINAGQAADLLVLEADPLLDIDNTRRIYAVVLNGRWFSP